MSRRYRHVDAFCEGPFTGNPAGVVVLEGGEDDGWMRSLADEVGFSETAFVGAPDAEGVRALRWFTPTREIDLCGHATLATAHVLWEDGDLAPEQPAVFATRSGELRCWREGDGIAMAFPAQPTAAIDGADVVAALGLAAREVVEVREGASFWLVVVDDAATVLGVTPDLEAVAALGRVGPVVTAPTTADGVDVVSRVFVPAYGIDEDPATGSAHCALATYWTDRLGRSSFRARQASARGGVLGVALDGDRVTLTGRALTVVRGELA